MNAISILATCDYGHPCKCHPSSRHPCTSQKMEMKEMNEEKIALDIYEIMLCLSKLEVNFYVKVKSVLSDKLRAFHFVSYSYLAHLV